MKLSEKTLLPLNERNQLLLQYINGDNGIVSSIGRGNHDRGQIKQYHKIDDSYNILTRIFFKGPEPTIYVSIVHDLATNALYISYPGSPRTQKSRALTKQQVDILKALLDTPTTSFDKSVKHALFSQMLQYENDFLVKQLDTYAWKESQKLRMKQPNDYNTWKILKHNHYQDLTFSDKQEIATRIFDDLFPNISAIYSQINALCVEVLPYATSDLHPYYAVHVEAKGVHYAVTKNPTSTQFNIGLNRIDGGLPGCCTGCAAEFDALHNAHGYTVTRTADFPENFAPNNYRASPCVTENDDAFLAFAQEIYNRCKTFITQNPALQQHIFFQECQLYGDVAAEDGVQA